MTKRKLHSSEGQNKRSHYELEVITIDVDEEDIWTSKGKQATSHKPVVIDVDNDAEEEDFGSILARIKEQEESEALARKLHDEWNGVASTSTSGAEVIVIDDDEGGEDAATARKLAQEWELEDGKVASALYQQSTGTLSLKSARSSASGSHLLLEQETPPDEQLLQYRDLFVAERQCTKCGKPVKSPRGHVMFLSDSLRNLTVLLHAPCSACRTNHCRGCFSPVSCTISCKGSATNRTCPVEGCCANGRAIALFEALGGFDKQYIDERATSASRAQAAMAKRKISTSGSRSVGPGGTGYGIDSYSGYNPGRRGSLQVVSPPKSRRDQRAAHWEEVVTRALITLTELLPSPYADSAQVYDMLPHPSLGPLLSLSQLPELLGSLLRNDSVTDWISRSETYYAMLGLLRRIADCELTIQTLISRRWEKEKSCGIEEWMWGDGEICWAREKECGPIERAPPLFDHFQKLSKQCQAFLTGASNMMDAEDGGSEEEMTMKATSLCGDIIAAKDDIERAMAVLGHAPSSGDVGGSTETRGKGKGRDPAIDMEKQYSLDCERLAFKYVTLSEDTETGRGLVYPDFTYASNLQQTASSTRNPKDRLHLVKELAVMATCLPPGVWARVDDVRNDVIKVMIAGPEDTPYAGGLFEFDCFMPIEYPNVPPLMHLRTTGGGRVRFNPNLYNNGKVCLSLLGTWPGRAEEQWSRQSSLLQVLVSIQSMILVEAPFYNEPGHGKANTAAAVSQSYNRNISLQTARWAIVDWLKDKHRDGIWGDVIASHFSIRSKNIRQCIQAWAAQDSRIRAYHINSTGMAGNPIGFHHFEAPQVETVSNNVGVDLVDEYERGMEIIRGWVKHLDR